MKRVVLLFVLLFGLMFSTALQASEIKGFDFFTGFSSKKQEQRFEAIKLFEKLPKNEKIKILREVYLNNNKLFEKHYYRFFLIESLELISSVKSEALEDEVHAKINKILDSVKADPKIKYKVPWFTDRLIYYISLLPYVGIDGDRSFDTIFRFTKLHHNTSNVNDGLAALALLPYKPNNDRILQLFEVLSSHASLQHIKKVFKRYANKKNNALFIKRLEQHIEELKRVKFEDNKGGRQNYLNERIKTFEKLVIEYRKKYHVAKTITKQASYLITDIHSIVSSVSPDNSIPVFHGSIPEDGPKRQAYNEKLEAGIYTTYQTIAELKYRIGLANLEPERIDKVSEGQAIYLLVSNPSDKDKVVSVIFQQINSAGYIINETKLTHNSIISNSINNVIGIKLPNLSPLSQDYNIIINVWDKDYAEPEMPLYERALSKSAKLSDSDFAFKKELIKRSGKDLPEIYRELFDQNQDKLKFDSLAKQVCKNNYSVSIQRFWSDKTEDQYLLYTASCTRWSGECDDGHQRQVLYKAPSAKGGKINQLLELVSKGNTFNIVESLYDINNDGDIELGMKKNYCLSSSTSIQKLKNGKLIMLNKVAGYSEGGYVENPLHRTNPFVYSQR